MRPPLERLAAALARAWREGRTIPLPPPVDAAASRAEAYAVQDRIAELLGEPCAGWKVGAAVRAVQVLEGHDGPIPGRLFASRVFASPARIPATLFDGYKIECEFAFRFDRAMPARLAGYAREELAAVVTFVPGLEVAGTRYAAGSGNRRPSTHDAIADNGAGGAYVVGTPVADWRRIDFARMPIEACIEGGTPVDVYSGELRRDAVDVLVEAVADLGARGIGLAAGAILSTGSLTVPTPLHRGQTFAARFGGVHALTVAMA